MGASKDLTDQTFNYWTVLYKTEKRNKGGAIYWHCKCKCGQEKDVLGTSLTSGSSKSCGCLKKEKASILKNDYTNQQFGNLLVLYSLKKENDNHIYWHCKCDCGNECDIRADRLPQATSCGCKTNEKRSEALREDLTNQKFGKLTALKPIFIQKNKKGKTYWYCECECGNHIYVFPESLKNKMTQSCGCIGQSIGENNIETILKNNNINYEKEKIFQNFIFSQTQKPGRYDFYLPELNRLIEFDGKQHFFFEGKNGWNTYQAFIERQQRDKEKNQYALEHNIPLVRIPYTERDNITLDMIMGDQYLVTSGDA